MAHCESASVAPRCSFLSQLNESRIKSMGIYLWAFIFKFKGQSVSNLCKACVALHCDGKHAKLQILWINALS